MGDDVPARAEGCDCGVVGVAIGVWAFGGPGGDCGDVGGKVVDVLVG